MYLPRKTATKIPIETAQIKKKSIKYLMKQFTFLNTVTTFYRNLL